MKKRLFLLPLLALLLSSCDYFDVSKLLESSENQIPTTELSEDDDIPGGTSEQIINSGEEPTPREVYGSDMPMLDPYETWGLLHEFEFVSSSHYGEDEFEYVDIQRIKLFADGGKLEMTTTYEDGDETRLGYFYHEAGNTAYMVTSEEESITAWSEDDDLELISFMLEQTDYMSGRFISQALMFYEQLLILSDETAITALLEEEDIDSLEISRLDDIFTFTFFLTEDDRLLENKIEIGFTGNKITHFVHSEKYYDEGELVMEGIGTIELVFLPTLPAYDGPRIAFEGEQTLRDLLFGSHYPGEDIVGTDLPEIKPYGEWEGVSAVYHFHTIRNGADPLNDIVMTTAFNFYEESALATVSVYGGDDSAHSRYLEGFFIDGNSIIYNEEDGHETVNTITPGSGEYDEFIASLNGFIGQLIYDALEAYRPITKLSSRAEMEEFATSQNMEEIYIDYYDDNTYYIMMDRYGLGTSQTSGEVVQIEASISMQITVVDGMFSYFSYRATWYEDGDEIHATHFYIEVTFDE